MKASKTQLAKFLEGTHQFVIPIYQRTYSWTEKQCEQLWNDIVKVAEKQNDSGHFIGSIVYIEKELKPITEVTQYLVIDGQQRLTTLMLLQLALSKALSKQQSSEVSAKKIRNRFLFNSDESGEEKYKLILTQSDKDTLINLLEGNDLKESYSLNIKNNYRFFENQIEKKKINLDLLYKGILKLIIVDIALERPQDNPQLIFESLNSTGMELSQADLIRNYILMGLDIEEQKKIYKEHWYQIEESFGQAQGTEVFDTFMRNYLTIKRGEIPKVKDVYSRFKEYFEQENMLELVLDIHYFAKFFYKLKFEKEPNSKLNQKISDINTLKVDVAYPFLLEVYSDFDNGLVNEDEITEIFLLVESYVFRRAICGVPTNSLNKTFANLASEIDKEKYLESLKAALILKKSYRRFPTNNEFASQLVIKDVYNTRRILRHLLEKLENYQRKELVNVDKYTIEHIMPQNKNLSETWKKELGEKWEEVHNKYLHTIGNLTLTGYNSELSDKPFLEKRDMEGGFAQSPITLNAELGTLECWNEDEIIRRAESLTAKAFKIWEYPLLPQGVLEKYSEIEDDLGEDIEEDDIKAPIWDQQLTSASDENRQTVNELISMINKKFECVSKPYHKWLFLYTQKPTERRNLFAIVTCGKKYGQYNFSSRPRLIQCGR